MDLLFLIATCERSQMLRRLISQILTQRPTATILVADDASQADYKEIRQIIKSTGGRYFRFSARQGKRKYWKVVDKLFTEAQQFEFDYLFKLDDDVILHPSAIEWSVSALNIITKRREKALFNMWVDHRAEQRIWTTITPKITRMGDHQLRRVGWVDGGNWAATREVMEIIGWSCPKPPSGWWKRGNSDSSGVGKYLSVRLQQLACHIYMPMESFIYHGVHDSVMHAYKNNQYRPIEMKEKPWET